jgi:protein-S-isoprenylcysteine O-methyltransferase Ste14
MYVGVMLVLLGQAMFFQSPAFVAYALGWLAWVHLSVLFYEEPNLRRRFGSSYVRYAAAVNRWVPGKAYRDSLS